MSSIIVLPSWPVVIRADRRRSIWLQKAVVVLLYRRLLAGLAWARYAEPACWATLAAFFAVVQVVTLTECSPFALFWLAPPAVCSGALVQLAVFAALSISTDLMLVLLPMPTVASVRRSTARYAEQPPPPSASPLAHRACSHRRSYLVPLFSIGLLVATATAVRLAVTYADPANDSTRAVLVAVETLAAAVVANVPTLYTLRGRRATSLSIVSSVAEMGNTAESPASQRAATATPSTKDDRRLHRIREPTRWPAPPPSRPRLTSERLSLPLPPLPLLSSSRRSNAARDQDPGWPLSGGGSPARGRPSQVLAAARPPPPAHMLSGRRLPLA